MESDELSVATIQDISIEDNNIKGLKSYETGERSQLTPFIIYGCSLLLSA